MTENDLDTVFAPELATLDREQVREWYNGYSWLAQKRCTALTQLQERDYAAKYRAGGHPIHLVGVEFSRQTRNITAFDTDDA